MKTPSGILNSRKEHDDQWLASSKMELEKHIDSVLDKDFDDRYAVVSRNLKTRSGPSHPKTELEVIAQYEANGWDVRWGHGWWLFLSNGLDGWNKNNIINRSDLRWEEQGKTC